MKLGVFTTSSSAYAPQRFKEEGAKLGISVKIVRYSDINFLIRDKKIKVFVENKFLPEFDLVIFRSFKRGFLPNAIICLIFILKRERES